MDNETAEATRKLAYALLRAHGLAGWRIELDDDHARFAHTSHDDHTIILSCHWVNRSSPEVIHNIILHEIAHALCPVGATHGRLWRKTARRIGCDGRRVYDPRKALPSR